jgi:hypothetical protein
MQLLGSMSSLRVAIFSFLGLAAMSMTAGASTTWTWGYSGSGITASGTFTTESSPGAGGGYLITDIAGTRNGTMITGLQTPGTSIPGNEPFTVDDLLFPGPAAQLTSNGFGFSLSDGSFSNPFYADFLPTPEYLEFFSIPGVGYTEVPVTFSAMPLTTPEPATFGLVFGTLVAVSALLRRNRAGA